jgi:hypothetical protein
MRASPARPPPPSPHHAGLPGDPAAAPGPAIPGWRGPRLQPCAHCHTLVPAAAAACSAAGSAARAAGHRGAQRPLPQVRPRHLAGCQHGRHSEPRCCVEASTLKPPTRPPAGVQTTATSCCRWSAAPSPSCTAAAAPRVAPAASPAWPPVCQAHPGPKHPAAWGQQAAPVGRGPAQLRPAGPTRLATRRPAWSALWAPWDRRWGAAGSPTPRMVVTPGPAAAAMAAARLPARRRQPRTAPTA